LLESRQLPAYPLVSGNEAERQKVADLPRKPAKGLQSQPWIESPHQTRSTMKRFMQNLCRSFRATRPTTPRRSTRRLGLEQLDERVLLSATRLPVGLPTDPSGVSYPSQNVGRHTLAGSTNGNFAVTWSGLGDSGYGIYTRLYKADGTSTSPMRIASTTDFDI